ncbi:hypothetical protein N474_13055 [Pseudoalteromonas luteoviolacea CPMOR-2]|uniref:Endonuclease YhcR N-terminal domain-containing protein n=1 Tax=Pseudoalteromonas luteoviolacea DSM 6061 TaxID=1365250 RepID=A0A166UHI3_9GAMM|nr:DUF6359 domain-containing protein [Pseudoalteromonas luteoviolacea]KZN30679.1 hypothetical protein N475_24445 [Pseudoalteromonas luteoviolacea DSM 6061]KZN56204.1 hypothetical protein N474_13055 [Pseudoalteromonas luteoviolacea CPMOR-2]MBE0388465.1 hypothetical protein [Pseudoalteromonas luteoviolacea DSM 6061]
MTVNKLTLSVLLGAGLLAQSSFALAAAYDWNNTAPVKVPTAANNNGKTVYFDVSHGGVEGNADWVIDGAFSDFADALVQEGYTVKEYRGVDLDNDGRIRFYDDRTNGSNTNEAIITYDAIKDSDVFVLAETNRPFTTAEQAALEQYIASGKGIFFIADHYDADRNLNTWDATEVFNGYNRSDLSKYNMGGAYGDWRNPKSANAGWLVENFGIRFRFNGVDYKQGVSGVEPSSKTEGITQGVDPILMAAGATLAIVDPQKAKGLVYFSETDTPVKWRHAKDQGLYFGGKAEGPYAAIAKSGAGKAAFIGDSSPIEDATPKYRRQDNGNTKKTYPGWTDPGHASVLAVNIINWLATPESYQYFDGQNGHHSGFVTPTPMATQEMSDPNNGQPWGTPASGFNPWDTDTYKNNSFNAPYGDGQTNPDPDPDPTPTPGNAISVADALAAAQNTPVVVVGKVTAAINGIYGLELSDLNNPATHIYVKLESNQRADFNPQLNPAILNQNIIVTGKRNSYMGEPGIRYVTELQIAPSYMSVEQALATAQGESIELTGRVKSGLNSIYALILEDLNNASFTINIKLESSQRAQFSPELNPDILNATLVIKGVRDSYMSQPGVRQVSSITIASDNGSNDPDQGSDLSVSDVLAMNNGQPVVVSGTITAAINNKYALELTDPNNSGNKLYIKLESSQRDAFSPLLNPELIGKRLRVEGIKNDYMSHPGVRSVSNLTLLN